MSQDENKISDQIDSGLSERDELLKKLSQLTTENARLREALERLISEMVEREKEYTINYKNSSRPEHWNGKLQELILIKKALTQALTEKLTK
jgi:regulator of replication initiation timing